ncbi:MAG TPA: PD-(D/E)XK nuclease family protein [Steroidobacteraceae bacterium]|nr:PD-(D/E)XK nuclease family protein [Steroidobacteraceae bacterium]
MAVGKDRLQPAVTTVVPTRRLAHWLRGRHDDDCLARGLEVWHTPDIVPWSEFVARTYGMARRAARVEGRWLPDAAARLAWERIALDDPATASLVSPGLAGRTAYQSWRTMHAYGIPPAALDEDDRPEALAFTRWMRRYTEWLSDRGWMDEPGALPALDSVSVGAGLEVVGFDELTPAQEAYFQRVVAAGTRVEHVQPQPRRGSATWFQCRDRAAEIDTATRWAAQRLQREPQSRLAIVVPDLAATLDEARRAIDRVLAPGATLTGGPAPGSHGYQLVAARALSAQPIVAAALEVIESFAHPVDLAIASRVLSNAFLAAARAESNARARLDALIRRQEGPGLSLQRLAQLAGQHGCPQLARALRDGVALAREWPKRALSSHWAHLWSRTLTAVGWPGPGLDSNEHQARERWQQLLGEIGATDDCVGPLTAAQAAALLRELADRTLFEPQELAAALTVIDPQTCAGMSFDALWICGLDAGRWPSPASPDPFLPREWQVRQRVPGATAELASLDARRLLSRLRASADEVILSVPGFDGDAPLQPSALLAGVPRGDVSGIWAAPSLARATFAARPEPERLVDGAMPPIARGATAQGGARLIETQSACPFRAQAEFRLGARALEDPELGIAAAERGELVHRVLARIWSELGDQLSLRRLSLAARDTLIADAITAECASLPGTSDEVTRHLLGIESDWLAARVKELLEADLGRPPFAVASLERDALTEVGGLTLRLRVDRVDRIEDGGLVVIDYKTGADLEPKAWLGERPRLPQLPLYAEAVGPGEVAALAFGRLRSGSTGYSGMARDAEAFPGLAAPGAKSWPKEFPSWTALRAEWRRCLAALAAEHAAGVARLAPDPARACQYCPLGILCRIGEAAAGGAAEDAGDD